MNRGQGRGEFIHNDRDSYGDTFNSHLLEQYKLYVQSAENVSARRVASSRYLLTLSVALVALYGFQASTFDQNWWTLLIPPLGVGVSLSWYLIIRSHADLNRVKFDLIHELEQHLPAALYSMEWRMATVADGRSYRAVTTIERWIPILFGVLHMGMAAIVGLSLMGVLK